MCFEEKRTLSAIDRRFRGLLAPALFICLRLSNLSLDDGKPALTLAEKYGKHVNRINFISYESPEADECYTGEGSYSKDDDDVSDEDIKAIKKLKALLVSQASSDDSPGWPNGESALPESISKLLSGQLLPNLSEIRVHFPLDFDDYAWGEADVIAGFYVFESSEGEHQAHEPESNRKWRASMAETWNAIASSKHGIRRLEIANLVPKDVSTFETEVFAEFLKSVGGVDISLLGIENGAGWCINSIEGYTSFCRNLGYIFFQDMSSVTRLRLAASEYGPLGLMGRFHEPLPLHPDHLPALGHLELEMVFIGVELVEFLAGHAKTL